MTHPNPKPDDLILVFEGGSVAAALTGMEASSRQNPFAASPETVGTLAPLLLLLFFMAVWGLQFQLGLRLG